jgi:beta-lactam-binding protein with PASTA domain
VVPKVVGKPLASAKRAITKAHCKTGKVTRAYSAKKAGIVIAERPKPRTKLKNGAKVNLTVSRGRRRR